MLLCDWCNSGWHTYCLEPKLESIPSGHWVCPTCTQAGITTHLVQNERIRQASSRTAEPPDPDTQLFTSANTRAKDKAAAAYDNRLICKQVTTKQGLVKSVWGKVRFLGSDQRPRYFKVTYDDGSTEILQMKGLKNRNPMPQGTVRPSLVQSVTHIPSKWCTCQFCVEREHRRAFLQG